MKEKENENSLLETKKETQYWLVRFGLILAMVLVSALMIASVFMVVNSSMKSSQLKTLDAVAMRINVRSEQEIRAAVGIFELCGKEYAATAL